MGEKKLAFQARGGATGLLTARVNAVNLVIRAASWSSSSVVNPLFGGCERLSWKSGGDPRIYTVEHVRGVRFF